MGEGKGEGERTSELFTLLAATNSLFLFSSRYKEYSQQGHYSIQLGDSAQSLVVSQQEESQEKPKFLSK